MGTFAYYSGTVCIPEDKKQDFNENMLKLLQLGGMMQFDTVSLYNKKINLITPVELDKDGKCAFHFNYFEDDRWETAGFDCNTNVLWSGKIGSNEFNYVMCAGYILTELYSNDIGWACENRDILNYAGYIQWINFILDKDFSAKKRFSLWKFFEQYFLREMEDGKSVSDIEPNIIFDFIPVEYRIFMGGTELADIFYACYGTEEGIENISKGSYAEEIVNLKKTLNDFYLDNPENGRDLIWQLITMPRNQRKEIKGKLYAELAQISLRIAARVFVYLSAEILGYNFFEKWAGVYDTAYSDEIPLSYVSDDIIQMRKEGIEASAGKAKTSAFLRNDDYFTFYNTPEELKNKENYYISDDDLMYWWDGSKKIELSEKMIEQIKKWHQDFLVLKEALPVEEVAEYNMIMRLMEVLDNAESFYQRIYAFNTMFYDFLEHSKDVNYIAAVKLLEKVVEDNKEEGKIIEKTSISWDLTSKNVTCNEGRINIKRILSLFANKKLREIYFGF
ncbi:MAG: hypothetical protein U0K95_02455 [Eubacterium sp.]|nr:hypothetical protein [Eubacterium sp.]